MAKAAQDARAKQIGHQRIQQPHHQHDQRHEQGQHGKSGIDFRPALLKLPGIDPHLLIHPERRIERLPHRIHLHAERIDRRHGEQQGKDQKLSAQRSGQRHHKRPGSCPSPAKAKSEHQPRRGKGKDQTQRNHWLNEQRHNDARHQYGHQAPAHAVAHDQHQHRQRPDQRGSHADHRQINRGQRQHDRQRRQQPAFRHGGDSMLIHFVILSACFHPRRYISKDEKRQRADQKTIFHYSRKESPCLESRY